MYGKLFAISLAAAVSFPVAASAEELCKTNKNATRLTKAQVEDIVKKAGHTDIRAVVEEDGCYEAKGFNAAGKRIEVYVHPETGQIVKVKEK